MKITVAHMWQRFGHYKSTKKNEVLTLELQKDYDNRESKKKRKTDKHGENWVPIEMGVDIKTSS